MLKASLVSTEDELLQIHQLNQLNLRNHLTDDEKTKEGFVTWLYSMDLLRNMHSLAPSVIVKDQERVVGYALVTPKEASIFHPDLKTMFSHLELLSYLKEPLFSYSFYCMGQICIDKAYRGQGLVEILYQGHKKAYSHHYELLITEISLHNPRSQKAHEKVGFKTINTYRDDIDQWNVVLWDWRGN